MPDGGGTPLGLLDMTVNGENTLQQATELMRRGQNAAAIAAFRQVLKAAPDLADAWYNLGYLLRTEGFFEEALAAYAEALARGVEEPEEVRVNRAVILADHLRRDELAETELRAAIAENADFAPAWLNLGNLLEERGDRDGATDCYARMLPAEDGSVRPHQDLRYEALARLPHLRSLSTSDDPLLGRLERAAASKGVMNRETRANLYYALGRAFDALRDYDRAFPAYEMANVNVRAAGPQYDRAKTEKDVALLIEIFTAPAPSCAPKTSEPRPVFICGMFRSGSTLVEQALAAHPSVIAGGELNLLSRLADVDLAPFPQSIRTLNDERANRLAGDYRHELLRLFPQSRRKGTVVTDKRPDNFLRIGLIKRLFPAARIIHTVRDPVDTCLSIFFQHIDQRLVGYASNLEDAAHYFGQYRRLMAHWKTLYGGDILDFDYDRFVNEPRAELKRLLDFIGLDWRDECLEFHKLRNTVKTASYWQVRRPLYRESSGRRRNYEKHIGPLVSALAQAGVTPD